MAHGVHCATRNYGVFHFCALQELWYRQKKRGPFDSEQKGSKVAELGFCRQSHLAGRLEHNAYVIKLGYEPSIITTPRPCENITVLYGLL